MSGRQLLGLALRSFHVREVGFSQDWLAQCFLHPIKDPQPRIAATVRVPHDNGGRAAVCRRPAIAVVHLMNGLPGIFPVLERHDSVVPRPPRLAIGGTVGRGGPDVLCRRVDMMVDIVGTGITRGTCHESILHARVQRHQGPFSVMSRTRNRLSRRPTSGWHVIEAVKGPAGSTTTPASTRLRLTCIRHRAKHASRSLAAHIPRPDRELQL